MNKIKIFRSLRFGEIRTLTNESGEPLFNLGDICQILDIKNVSDCKSRLNPDGVVSGEVIDSMGRTQKATFVNESNLYKSIFQSRKPDAEAFTDWVTREVLPSIRKHGAYMIPELKTKHEVTMAIKMEIPRNLEWHQRIIPNDTTNLERSSKEHNIDSVMNISVIAHDLGISAKVLNFKLQEAGVQHKERSYGWMLSPEYTNKGLIRTRTTSYNGVPYCNSEIIIEWTELGRRMILSMFPNGLNGRNFESKMLNETIRQDVNSINRVGYYEPSIKVALTGNPNRY